MKDTHHLTSAPFEQFEKKINSDGGDYGNKKCRRGDDGAYGVFWRGQHLAGVWSQAVAIELMRLAKI
jgi:hypothetical protein